MNFDPQLRIDDLPLDDAARVRMLMTACEWLARQQYPTHHFAQAAVDVSAKLAGLEGNAARPLSMQTMRRLYYDWVNGKTDKKTGEVLAAPRTWLCLVDRRTVAANRAGARTAQRCFLAHLAKLAARHNRSRRTAVQELYNEWYTCQTIPGYEGLNYAPNMPLPEGWSYDNLCRRMPDAAALRVLHEGVRAAYADLAQVFSTRAGMWPAAVVSFDDVWLDCHVQGYDGNGKLQIGRPLQLGCIDRYTGMRLSWFTKLRTKGEDGHSLQLNSDEMLYLLCNYLYNVGYSKRGTVLVCEHGTAAISQAVEEQLAIISGGKITVERSGMTGRRQAGAFGGRGVGNPRFKAELESWHSLLHNRMDGVLTQAGRNRTEPEKLHGLLEHEKALIKAGETLPAERALALAPFSMTLAQLGDFLAQVVGGINNRTDHQLEGWEECGFCSPEFSFNAQDGWQLMTAMNADDLAEAQALIERKPERMRLRKLSPCEAWNLSQRLPGNELVRFTPAECVALMGAHRKFKLSAKGGCFHIESRSRHHRTLLFKTEVLDARGHTWQLPTGQDYFGVLNPFSEELFVLDDRNRVLGAAPIYHRAAHVDEAARLRVFGDVMHRRAEELARIENMVAPDTAEHRAQLEYNRAVTRGEAFDPLGIADERTTRRLANRAKRTPEPEPAYLPTPAPAGLGLPDAYESSSFNY